MQNIVTNCKKHGQVNIENAKKISQKNKNFKGYRCNLCVKDEKNKYYKKKTENKVKKRYQNYDLKFPEKRRNQWLKRDFNMNLEEYNYLLKIQNNVCKICKNPEIVISKYTGQLRNLAVDHCHKTNKIRGLLCARCNKMLGMAKDSIEILESAINYLKVSIL